MSLGKQKNLIVLGAVLAALLVGGVLVADYADVLPGRAKADEPIKACAAGEAKPCCAAEGEAAGCSQAVAATEAAGFPQVMAATETAPAQACCEGEKPAVGCGEPKACCGDEKPAGCCGEPKPAAGCCGGEAPPATK